MTDCRAKRWRKSRSASLECIQIFFYPNDYIRKDRPTRTTAEVCRGRRNTSVSRETLNTGKVLQLKRNLWAHKHDGHPQAQNKEAETSTLKIQAAIACEHSSWWQLPKNPHCLLRWNKDSYTFIWHLKREKYFQTLPSGCRQELITFSCSAWLVGLLRCGLQGAVRTNTHKHMITNPLNEKPDAHIHTHTNIVSLKKQARRDLPRQNWKTMEYH